MKTRLAVVCALLFGIITWSGAPASGHRLDEYLQATTISVEKDRVQVQMRLTPGVAVYPAVFADMDTDADGVLSQAEQRAYAERVLRDLSLRVNDEPLRLRLVSQTFAETAEMRAGRGEILLDCTADVPRGGRSRRLVFENHHQSRIAVYLVNCLVPRDPAIHITAQDRNYQQSLYQLDYAQAGVRSGPPKFAWGAGAAGWMVMAAFLLSAPFAWLWWQRAREARNGAPADGPAFRGSGDA